MLPSDTNFILSPVLSLLKEALAVIDNVCFGIEAYPLADYFFQSVFLKMTGFQEQKLKCICWELGVNNYEYRYELLKNKLGECSSVDDKNNVYKDLIKQIKEFNSSFTFNDWKNNVNNILHESCKSVVDIIKKSMVAYFFERALEEFDEKTDGRISLTFSFTESKLLSNHGLYERLYRHRNRCAHNLRSYQQNLPDLKELSKDNYYAENYIEYFALLVSIDGIFINLYDKYLNALKNA